MFLTGIKRINEKAVWVGNSHNGIYIKKFYEEEQK